MKTFLCILCVIFLGINTSWATQLIVTGQASMKVHPDVASVAFTVLGEGQSASAAKQIVDQKVTSIRQSLQTMGKRISLSSGQLTVRPQYKMTRDHQQNVVGYRASRNVVVELKQLSLLGTLLDSGFKNGADALIGIHYQNSHWEHLQKIIRIKALRNGQQLAAQFAQALHKHVVALESIEYSGENQQPIPIFREMKLASGSGYQSKALTMTDSVLMRFRLK